MLMSGLVLVWAMPVVVAVQVWYWMTNFENGVLTYVLSQLHSSPPTTIGTQRRSRSSRWSRC